MAAMSHVSNSKPQRQPYCQPMIINSLRNELSISQKFPFYQFIHRDSEYGKVKVATSLHVSAVNNMSQAAYVDLYSVPFQWLISVQLRTLFFFFSLVFC
jgi:hypothetical protein